MTPLIELRITVHGRPRRAWLKLEGANPTGSIKYRVARALLRSLDEHGALGPGRVLIESTSGNLGVALAALARERGIPFLAVVDPNVTGELLQAIRAHGGVVRLVDAPDESGGFLASRLRTVQELVTSHTSFVWPNQYENAANPLAHYTETAPEIDRQAGLAVQAVLVAVSTGGTYAGVSRYFREHRPRVRTVAVDVAGSVVLGGAPGPRRLSGIGSGRQSSFFRPASADSAVVVGEREAVLACRRLADLTGLRLGASSGAVLAACLRLLAGDPELADVVCVCADFGASYRSTVYDDAWVAALDARHAPLAEIMDAAFDIAPPSIGVLSG